ncbi:YciI family protein [Microbacterium sp. VKM Ac-2923]|uniref:YciI family protein n=1 Tax=Microbacterium sp. VKM Ac-2923 TaxID=2929476 RepID=UPI001FB56D2B|nr:hypothetical protein [Microbacterium sp. VKM Ac-2923]MCJ1709023.1 hypothetical protein [Microbacterium sp. VKM Ac-2923]
MKVMLLMWSDDSYSGGGDAADYAAWAEFEQVLRGDGVLTDSGHFAEPVDARTVVTSISAEPDAALEPSPALAGYYLLEVDGLDTASAYARRAPLYGTVEVRPLVQY